MLADLDRSIGTGYSGNLIRRRSDGGIQGAVAKLIRLNLPPAIAP
jgi:hypothetical protein